MLIALAGLLLWGCTSGLPRASERVSIKGSDTMLILTVRWAEAFMVGHPRIAVYAEGGGTETGVRALIDGQVDICAASRPLRGAEVEALYERHGTLGVSVLSALDGISIYLNPANPVRNLTFLQLKGIFNGRIGTWAKVDGRDEPITVLIRQPSSGTYRFFRERVLDEEEYSQRAITLPGTQAVVDAVRRDPTAIGYGGIAYGSDVVHCRIDGVEATGENVHSGAYPLARYLQLVAVRPPSGAVKELVDWVLSPAGQRVVAEVGFIPLWPPS